MVSIELLIIIITCILAILLCVLRDRQAALLLAPVGAGLLSQTSITGSGDKKIKRIKPVDYNALRSNRLIISDKATLVFDGNNLVHQYAQGSRLSHDEFDKILRIISGSLADINDKNIHIVIKNPDHSELEKTLKHNESFQVLKELSKQYPTITYHLAYGKEASNDEHYMKGRDDFLAFYIASIANTDGYIISKDMYRDFKDFKKIKTFTHLSINDDKLLEREKITPSRLFSTLDKPTIGNHLTYEFVSAKKHDRQHGIVYIEDGSKLPVIYLFV
jgi:hypothetical protein